MKITKDTYPALYDFQKEGVEFLHNNVSALLADEVGTGKTAQALHGCIAVGARTVLVICTASIKFNWRKEAIKWGFNETDIHILCSDNIHCLPATGIFIINYDRIWRKTYAKALSKRRFDVLICDESHYLKNHESKRAKAVWLKNGYCDMSTYRWMLTATPILNRPVELHAMLSRLCPDRLGGFKNYVAYTQRYCNGKPGKWGWDATGATNLEELAGRLSGFMLRRTRDVLPELTMQKIYMPYSKEVQKHVFNGEENESVRKLIGIGKIKPSAEHIKDILEAGEKVCVFAYHIDVIKGLYEELKEYKPAVIRGATSASEREKAITDFKDSPSCRVFIGQIDSAGEGIDGLQHSCSIGVFVEISHTPGRIRQAIGRIRREGQTSKTLFQFLIVEGTIDEQILDSTIFKEKNIQKVMKDEKRVLDFKPKQKEKKMSMEVELKRIADALETLVAREEKEVTEVINKVNIKEAIDGLNPPVAKKPRKPRTPKVKVTPKVVEVVEPVVVLEDYQARMRNVATLISTFTGDAVKTNAMFAELQGKFKESYPNNAHVFDVEEKDQPQVEELVKAFLVEKGVI